MNDLSKVTSQFASAHAPRVSVVLPLHNAGKAILDRIAEVAVDAELARINLAEIIAVDDGSDDMTWSVLEAEARLEPRLRPIRLRRHFGQATAREAGALAAAGDVVVTLEPDAPAADLGQFVGLIEAGHDVVIGWRGGRRVKPSRLVGSITGLHLRSPFSATAAYRRDLLKALDGAAESLFNVPFAAQRLGYRVGEMEIAAPPERAVRWELAEFAALCSELVRHQSSERWLGLMMLAGGLLIAAAVAILLLSVLLGVWPGVTIPPLGMVMTAMGLLLCGVQLAGMAMLGSMGRRRLEGGRSKVSSHIAETLLKHGKPD